MTTGQVLLLQLPVPQTNFGRLTGNVPLAAAWLAQSAAAIGRQVAVAPEAEISYLGDVALLDYILSHEPDIVGFTVYCWNLDRTLALAGQIKAACPARIVVGGPEITPDNPRLAGAPVDFMVHGEGEMVFQQLLSDAALWQRRSAHGSADSRFPSSPSPYLTGRLDPGPGNIMLLETQRGCPFHCAYCYYNKARSRMAYADEALILQAVTWAADRGVEEIYLLDPCLSARPHLHRLLEQLARRNPDGRIGLVSEIRAEAVDAPLADLFRAAGFRWFEIGLQSTTPLALEQMNRRTDLAAFARGARLLKERGISPRIDLILGLPGDTLDGFRRSVDFLVDHGITDDLQLFPLSVLPGTEFRNRHRALGLTFTPAPPYTVLETPTFSRTEMRQAIAYAEEKLDTAFYLLPDLNIAWQKGTGDAAGDVMACIGGRNYCAKLYLDRPRPAEALRAVAQRMSFPYQIYVAPAFTDEAALVELLGIISAANPFTPFEVVFLAPRRFPDCDRLLSAIRLRRPHFLDLEERFLMDRLGNRAVLFTIVTDRPEPHPTTGMVRQVFWWRKDRLPDRPALESLFDLDGVVIDAGVPDAAVVLWQDRFAPEADRLPAIAFSRIALQHRWLLKTAPDQWAAGILGATANGPPEQP